MVSNEAIYIQIALVHFNDDNNYRGFHHILDFCYLNKHPNYILLPNF